MVKVHWFTVILGQVTDKNLFRDVVGGKLGNKEARINEDAYIYMVLEYGEIDLAQMLLQKWKEMDAVRKQIDENWLRFYWQVCYLADLHFYVCYSTSSIFCKHDYLENLQEYITRVLPCHNWFDEWQK